MFNFVLSLSHTNIIFQDYGNPLTHFAMQDFPKDGGKGMSQVFSGKKMLVNLPSPPVAQVDRKVFCINELLQDSSGDYFIPECFFLGSLFVDDDHHILSPCCTNGTDASNERLAMVCSFLDVMYLF
jgi:hypothetical protein